ncbi:MAG: metallophosphoesterase family protein [Promethearchaeota archaeon]
MYKIGILSDTLIKSDEEKLPNRVIEALKGVDLIIHAGNICKSHVIEQLQSIAPVEAVRGCDDDPEDFEMQLPDFKILNIKGYKIGVFNEKPDDDVIKKYGINILIHGKTCIPKIEETENLRLSLNPGSPTCPKKTKNGTIILLKISDLLFSYIIKT